MSDLEQYDEGTHLLVKYRTTQGATVKSVAGPVTESRANRNGWIMHVSPTRALNTVRLESRERGALVKVREGANTWRRIGAVETIRVGEGVDE